MPKSTGHPSEEQLSAYNLGQLPPDEAVAIESHVSKCETCCDTIISLSSDDTFVGLLKDARQLPTDQTVDHGVVSAAASLQEVPSQLSEHPRYEVLGLIGRGGMGDVYRARHRKMERTVALKVINRGLVQKADAVDRFHREVKAAAQLSHPNIVTSHDADQAGDFHFMVMEHVDGVDLSQTVKDRGALPVAETCDYIRQAAIGLQHAHERGMVHRDIKPHNLMVTADGIVKILDFGLASLAPEAISTSDAVAARPDLTAAGAIMGTPDFISPEQANDARQVDIRSDIYSLGATLYYLLSGRVPFDDGSVMHKLRSHAQVEPAPLNSVRDDVPEELVAIASKMMAKDPDERYFTPKEVANALESFLQTWQPDSANSQGQLLLGGGNNIESGEKFSRAGDARWNWFLVAASVLIVGCLAAGLYYTNGNVGGIRVEVIAPEDIGSLGHHPLTIVDTSGKKPLGGTASTHKDDPSGITTHSFKSANGRYNITLVDEVLTVNGERYTLENPTDTIRIVDDRVEITQVAALTRKSELKITGKTVNKGTSGLPSVYDWNLDGHGVGELKVRLLLAQNGKTGVIQEFDLEEIPTEFANMVRLEVRDDATGAEHMRRVNAILSVESPVPSRSATVNEDEGLSIDVEAPFSKKIEQADLEPIEPGQTEVLLALSYWKGDIAHDLSMESMTEATKDGNVTVLFVTLDWSPTFVPAINGKVTEQILDRMKKTYAECKSYRDSGVIKSVFLENTVSHEFTVEHSFDTAFVRPDRFRFEIKDQDDDKLLISADGENVQASWDIEPGIQKLETLDLAMAQAIGATGGDVGRIPAMLMPKKLDGWGHLDLIDPKQIEDGSLQNAKCFRLEYSFRDEQVILWIDKQSYLVRRIDEQIKADDVRIERTTNFDPTIDVKITDRMLEFHPPAPRAAVDSANMLPGSALGGNDSPTRITQERDADANTRKAGQQRSGNQLEMPLCWCPAGDFKMGRKQLPVTLTRGFWIGKYEVTQAQYEAVMGDNPSENKGESLPVEKVTWNEAKQFCQKLTEIERKASRLPQGWEYRLPTEAQWEYACRAGATLVWDDEKELVYPSTFGDDLSELGDYAWYFKNSDGKPHPVGQKKPNAWGLCDMHGNVREWVRDAWQSKLSGGQDPEVDVSLPIHARRGGDWFSYAEPCGSPFIRGFVVGGREVPHMMGFRVALVPVDESGAGAGGDLTQLQGDWETESLTESGNKLAAKDGFGGLLLQIKGNKFVIAERTTNGETSEVDSGRIEVNITSIPKTIDFIGSAELRRGIYEFGDDLLRICLIETSGTDAPKEKRVTGSKTLRRPTKFESPADSNVMLIEFRPTGANELKNVSQLMRQANQPGRGSRVAINELLRREDEGLLDSNQLNDLIEVILKYQADRGRRWRTGMGDLIEKRWVDGKLDRDIWETYTAQFLIDICELKVRPRIVIGSPNGVLVRRNIRDLRCGSGKYIEFLLREKNGVTRVGSTIVGRDDLGGTTRIGHDNSGMYSANSSPLTMQQWDIIEPGKQKITFDVELKILESVGPEASEGLDVFASRKATFETEAIFLPVGQPTVNVNVDPSIKDAVNRAITINRVETSPMSTPTTSAKYSVRVVLAVLPRPIDNIFTIVLRDGETEYDSGSHAHVIKAEDGNDLISVASIAADLSGKRIDVILRPAPEEAENSIDLFEIWGEEIVFEDVLVQ